MKTSDRGIAFLAAHEGIVPAPYLDSVSVWTYGVGHTGASGAPIPSQMARGMPDDLEAALRTVFAVFRSDLARYEADVSAMLAGIEVKQHQFDAAVSFHFNTGAIKTATWVKQWRAGDLSAAKKSIMNWRKPASIIDRRKEERDLWATGAYVSSAVPVWQADANGRVIWRPVRTLSQDQIIAYLKSAEPDTSTPAVVQTPELPSKWSFFGRK